jgi:hypothetical protein
MIREMNSSRNGNVKGEKNKFKTKVTLTRKNQTVEVIE